LWQDEKGRYLFVAPKESPPRREVIVDRSFRHGEVRGRFDAQQPPQEAHYPLQDIDIHLFVNWLANHGDLVLHATGIDDGGRGYCFAGSSGSGKSTLADLLAAEPAVTVLGEDQVILRKLAGRFWIFGTPWHLDPARCSPRGVPLHKLFFLDRTSGLNTEGAAVHRGTGASGGARPCEPLEGTARLLQTAFVPYYRSDAMPRILDSLAHLAGQVPYYTLRVELGTNVMATIREA
jgi:hypothetical protein